MTTGKTIALTILTFVGKVMSLIFNMLSVIVCLSEGAKMAATFAAMIAMVTPWKTGLAVLLPTRSKLQWPC